MRKKDWTFEDRLRFDISMALKNSKRIKRKYDDDDPYGPIAHHILEQLRLAGWRIESTLGTFEPVDLDLEEARAVIAERRAARRAD